MGCLGSDSFTAQATLLRYQTGLLTEEILLSRSWAKFFNCSPVTQDQVSMFSHLTFTALPDLASTDLCHLIFSVTFTHTVAQQRQISHCPFHTPVFPIPTYAFAHVSLNSDILSSSSHVQHYLSFNVWLKCSLTHKTFLDSPATEHLSFLQMCGVFIYPY